MSDADGGIAIHLEIRKQQRERVVVRYDYVNAMHFSFFFLDVDLILF